MNHKTIVLVAVSLLYGVVLNACCIDLFAEDIESYIGDTIKCHEEHKVTIYTTAKKKVFSFPLEQCTSLLLEQAGGIKWFFSSAVDGKVAFFGRAIEILNPSITHVYAVRASTSFGHIQIYFGYDTNKPMFNNAKWTVYEGNVLYIHTLSKENSTKTHVHCSKDARYLSHATITEEIKNHIDDRDCNSLEFQQMYKKFFCQKNGCYHSLSGCLVSSLCHWADEKSEVKEAECDENKDI